ncbi:hypothetical protein EV401DRAFT_1118340 [Pisolithus croceorrhizus]|nr:hypothetical protein EV401DRAFT_1118340 [Pisolithus croceorrhizus]
MPFSLCWPHLGTLARKMMWTNHSRIPVCSRILFFKLWTYSYKRSELSTSYRRPADSRASHVPVGEDQQQHVELTRDLAEIFDRTFSGLNTLGVYPTWMESESLFSALATLRDTLPTLRVVQLTNPVDVARLSTTHYYDMAVRALENDLAQCTFRIEDHDGNLLLGVCCEVFFLFDCS